MDNNHSSQINRANYESWFLDYVEGALSDGQIYEVHRFLDANPDLKIELEEWQQTVLEPDLSVVYEGKALLKRENKVIPFHWILKSGMSIAAALVLFLLVNKLVLNPTDSDPSIAKTNTETNIEKKAEPNSNANSSIANLEQTNPVEFERTEADELLNTTLIAKVSQNKPEKGIDALSNHATEDQAEDLTKNPTQDISQDQINDQSQDYAFQTRAIELITSEKAIKNSTQADTYNVLEQVLAKEIIFPDAIAMDARAAEVDDNKGNRGILVNKLLAAENPIGEFSRKTKNTFDDVAMLVSGETDILELSGITQYETGAAQQNVSSKDQLEDPLGKHVHDHQSDNSSSIKTKVLRIGGSKLGFYQRKNTQN
ncbi:MAG: hypothetical protein ACI959_000904 [Limisphaerales bacterium]|jgi:hypothetical protein